MSELCSSYFHVNSELLSRASAAFLDYGRQHWDPSKFDAAVAKEITRREHEISSLSAADWCRYKKSDYVAAGMDQFFK